MTVLSDKNYQKAEEFILTNARELERNIYYYHFKPIMSSYQDVVHELIKFQNSDGGFGNALEPDVRMKKSSIVATKYALQILIDINASSSEQIVRDGISFILKNYNEKSKTWELVDENVEAAPHAPWWNFDNLSKEFNQFNANPKAGILRILLHYKELVPEEIISEVTVSLMEHFKQLSTKMNFFDAIGFLQLLQTKNLDISIEQIIKEKMIKTASVIVSTNPDEWHNFSIKPIWLAPSPTAPLYKTLEKDIPINLDFEINNQLEDGSWIPSWSWNNKWSDEWEQAKNDWQGILTLTMLRILRNYNRIDGISFTNPGLYFKYPID